MYTLVESAKANGLEPWAYLNFLFENLPAAKSEQALLALLPQNLKTEDLKGQGQSGSYPDAYGTPGKPDVPKMSPEQALTVEEAIIAYTINTAWSLMVDDVTGSIEIGNWADMIVLNHNLLEIPKMEIHKTEVQKTIFKGKVVYEKE